LAIAILLLALTIGVARMAVNRLLRVGWAMLRSLPALSCFLVACLSARAASPPSPGYRQGAVASDHRLASLAGVEILRQGGNAVDAACATAFALGVVNPAGSGIGGGGFLLLRRRGQAAVALDFRETAPAAASREMFRRAGVPVDASRVGGLAVAIPGEVRGCAEAVRRHGRLPLARVLAPAIRLAERGFPAGLHLCRTVASMQRELAADRGLASVFLPGGRPLHLGETVRRPALARTLRRIAAAGPDGFYRGPVARAIVAAVRARGGILTLADLEGYRVKDRAPLVGEYRGFTVTSMPPPSSGGVALLEALNLLERRAPLAPLGHNSSRYLHLLAEAVKHAMADRARHLGDPDFVKVPVETLVSKRYAASLVAKLGERTLKPEQYGSRAPLVDPPRDRGTSHVSVVDREGSAVAMTTTINLPFGSLLSAGASGVILNNQMDDFAARPGEANAFGLTQGEQNAVAPGKRPLSSMTPTIFTRRSDGELRLVAGASGGPTIITGTLQGILNVVEFGLDANAAVGRARIHHQWLPDELTVEAELPDDVTSALRRRGHRLHLQAAPFTAVQLVLVQDGQLYPASDPRKVGEAAGF
jgi:gamma-glutamyltranspeptidase/glutathione hydrolase